MFIPGKRKLKQAVPQVTFTEGFRLYCTTRLPRPHFSPELSAKMTVVDFSVTQVGLEDQLLGKLILKVQQQSLQTGVVCVSTSQLTGLFTGPSIVHPDNLKDTKDRDWCCLHQPLKTTFGHGMHSIQ